MAGDCEHISPPHKQWDRGEKKIIICNGDRQNGM